MNFKNHKWKIVSVCVGALVLILSVVLVWKSCGNFAPEYDIAEIRGRIDEEHKSGLENGDYTNLENGYIKQFLTQYAQHVNNTWYEDSIDCGVNLIYGQYVLETRNKDMGSDEFDVSSFDLDGNYFVREKALENPTPITIRLGNGRTTSGFIQAIISNQRNDGSLYRAHPVYVVTHTEEADKYKKMYVDAVTGQLVEMSQAYGHDNKPYWQSSLDLATANEADILEEVTPFLRENVPAFEEYQFGVYFKRKQLNDGSYFFKAEIRGVRYINGMPTNETSTLDITCSDAGGLVHVVDFFTVNSNYIPQGAELDFDFKKVYEDVSKAVKRDLKGIDGVKSINVKETPLILVSETPSLVYRIEVIIDGGDEDIELSLEYIVTPK